MSKKYILYIEDNPRNLRLIGKILAHAGYEFIEAIDGASGLNVAATVRPDLILMDVNLPDIDGLEVTRRIKARRDLHQVPIVAVTANSQYEDRERCIEAGCDGYLAKPVLKEVLLQTVANFIS